MTFSLAFQDLCTWLAARDGAPAAILPAAAQGTAPEATPSAVWHVTPWRLTTPARDLTGPHTRASAQFVVWTPAPDPQAICTLMDAVFFAAVEDPRWQIADATLPEGFWQGPAPAHLILSCEVTGPDGATRTDKRVQHLPALDISPDLLSRERT